MYSDFKTNFDKLWEKDGSFSIYHRNIQNSATEKFTTFEWTIPTNNEWSVSGWGISSMLSEGQELII